MCPIAVTSDILVVAFRDGPYNCIQIPLEMLVHKANVEQMSILNNYEVPARLRLLDALE